MRIAPLIAFAAAAMLIAPPATAAASYCAPRDKLLQQLAENYGETRRAGGVQGGHAVVEVYASAETGSWTIVLTRPDGDACAVAAGQSWSEEAGVLALDPEI